MKSYFFKQQTRHFTIHIMAFEIELQFSPSKNFRLFPYQYLTPFWFAQVIKLIYSAMQQKTNAL